MIAGGVATSSSAHRLVLHVLSFLIIPASCLYTHYLVCLSDEGAMRLTKVHSRTCTNVHINARTCLYMHLVARAYTSMLAFYLAWRIASPTVCLLPHT